MVSQENFVPRSHPKLPGRSALIASIAGTLVVICAEAAYRRPIDYNRADGRSDAKSAFAFDTRYLAVESDYESIILSPGQAIPTAEQTVAVGKVERG